MARLAMVVVAAAVQVLLSVSPTSAQEITWFNADKKPVAYVGDDLTIYIWGGKPVAYLEPDETGGFHIYGFNGKHLGWYVSGMVRDHTGHPVGARKEAFSSAVQFEGFKGYKRPLPSKAEKKSAPVRPLFADTWSQRYLDEFLDAGARSDHY